MTAWLVDLDAELPCGPDLEYDPSFLGLERAVSGRPEAEYGDTLVAAVPPDWKEAEQLCVELMSRTRDLRVSAHLVRARLMRHGVGALAEGLALIEGLLERQWQHVHPQLDAGDGDDATARINALALLVEPAGMPADLVDIQLVPTRRVSNCC